jgi:hypothetical protein
MAKSSQGILLATNAALKFSLKKNTRRKDGGIVGWLAGWLAAGGGVWGVAEIGGGVIDYFHGCCSWCIYVTTIFLLKFFLSPN